MYHHQQAQAQSALGQASALMRSVLWLCLHAKRAWHECPRLHQNQLASSWLPAGVTWLGS